MSISLMTEAFKTNLPPTHRFVFVALCDNANDQGMCYPSVSMLSEKTGFTERSVIKSISYLEESGYLKREFRSGRSTYYFITNPCTWFTPEPRSPLNHVHPTPEPRSPPPLNHVHPTPEPRSPITIIEPSIEPSGNHHKKNSVPKFSARTFLILFGVDEQTADDWLLHRKTKRAAVTQTVIEQHASEAKAAGISLAEALRVSCSMGWQGFKADWMQSRQARASPRRGSIEEENARNKAEIFGKQAEEPYTIDM